MKRTASIISSDPSNENDVLERSVKIHRANLSLFSIATLFDGDADENVEEEPVISTDSSRGRSSTSPPSKTHQGGTNNIPNDVEIVDGKNGEDAAMEDEEVDGVSSSKMQTSVRPPRKVSDSTLCQDGEEGVVTSLVSSIPVSLDCSDDLDGVSSASSDFLAGEGEDIDDLDDEKEDGTCTIQRSTTSEEIGENLAKPPNDGSSFEFLSKSVPDFQLENLDAASKRTDGSAELENSPLCLDCSCVPFFEKEIESTFHKRQKVETLKLPAREVAIEFKEPAGVSSDSTISDVRLKTKLPQDCKTGLVFEAGSKHFDRHNRFHKERPQRITSIRDYLLKAKSNSNRDDEGLVEKTIFERCKPLGGQEEGGSSNESNRCIVDSSLSPAQLWLEDENYLRVHLPGYMQRLDRISQCTCHDRLDIEAEQYKSIYFTNDSVREAKAAASSLCRLVSQVVSGQLDNGFAVIRPPGHHAEPGLAGGYCVINNVAVAAAYAREKLGTKKVLIVDWDVHHGNGTQRIFIDDPNVLYFSVHRYHGGNFFPFHEQGGPSSVGDGEGKGFNINVGWNEKKMGDEEYVAVWEKILMPIASEFNPGLVLVSAGFDAARGDMGECDVTPECFGRLTRQLKTLAGGKIVCALEGGYVRSVLCKCVESVLASLLDSNSNDKSKEETQALYESLEGEDILDLINPSAAKSIRETMKTHCEFWRCLEIESNGCS